MSNKEMVQHLGTYYDIYKFVSGEKKTKEEVLEHLINEKDVKVTTARRYIKTIVSEQNGVFDVCEDSISINEKILEKVISKMYAEFNLAGNADKDVVKSMSEEIKQLNMELRKLRSLNKELNEKIDELETNILVIRKDYDKSIRRYINEKMERGVVFASNVSFEPKPDNAFDKMMLADIPVAIDVEKCISRYGGERKSFYDTSEVQKENSEKILTEENYKGRIARCIMSVPFFRHWKNDIDEEKTFMEENGIKPIESKAMVKYNSNIGDKELTPLEKCIEESYIKKARAIEQIMANDSLSNQMKLQLYARFSLAHGTEFEQLINYAADYNLDARWFVSVVNDSPVGDTFENMRDTLKVFAKSSEARQRLDFARELVDGVWHIVMDYGDEKKVPFVLVPAKEIEAIKEIVNDPDMVFRLPSDVSREVEAKNKKSRSKRNVKKELVEAANKCPDINEMSKNATEKKNADSDKMQDELPKKPEYVHTYGVDKDDIDSKVYDAYEYGGEQDE